MPCYSEEVAHGGVMSAEGTAPRRSGIASRALVRLLVAGSLVGTSLIGPPASAQYEDHWTYRLQSAGVIPELADRAEAERLVAVLRALGNPFHHVEAAGGRYRVVSGDADWSRRWLGSSEPPEAAPIVLVDGVHDGVRRLYSGENQEVRGLTVAVEAGGEAGQSRVVIAVEAHAAALVITGHGAAGVRRIDGRPNRFGVGGRMDGEGWAVRHLGPQRSERLVVDVPEGSQVTLVTRYVPIALRLERGRGEVWVDGIPADDRFALSVRLDGRAVATEERPSPRSRAVVLPDDLEPGRHRVRAELSDGETGEAIAWVEGNYFAPAHWRLDLLAGGGPGCFVLDRGAVAHHRAAEYLPFPARARIRPGRVDGRYYGEGTEVCVWAPWWGGPMSTTQWLTETSTAVPAVIDLEVTGVPPALLWLATLLLVVIAGSLLAWGLWPRSEAAVTHVAWTVARSAGYRDREAAVWKVATLPDAPTSLGALDEGLAGHALTVGRGAQGRAVIEPAGPVVVAPPEPHAITTQLAQVSVPSGTVIVDGTLRVALLRKRDAEKVRAGAQPLEPDPDAVERARAHGFTMELVLPPRPSRLARALGIGLGALATTAASFVPGVVGSSVPPLEIYTDTLWAWLAMAGVCIFLLGGTMRRVRGNARAPLTIAPTSSG